MPDVFAELAAYFARLKGILFASHVTASSPSFDVNTVRSAPRAHDDCMPPDVKSWRAADAGQRRDLGRTVTGRSAIYMYHRVPTCTFLRGLILLLRLPTGRGASSTMRDCSSAASRV